MFTHLETDPGVRLRAGVWPVPALARGTVILLQGRAETLEKYFETAGELIARGFAVATFDWRGQGGSTRLHADPLRGHVDDFGAFDRDLATFFDIVVRPQFPPPFYVLAHSMGGNIGLRFVHDRPGELAGLIVTAPMLAIKTAPFPRWLARILASSACALGYGEREVFGRAAHLPWDEPFEGNVVTKDKGRFQRNLSIVAKNQSLALSRPSFSWLQAAFRSMALIESPGYAAAIETPVLLFSAGQDRIVNPGADMRLIRRLRHGVFVMLGAAGHEILQETDDIRRAFWATFDAFLANAFVAQDAEARSAIASA